jgi:hypothetical protein
MSSSQHPAGTLRLTQLAAELAHHVRNPLAGARANVTNTARRLHAAGIDAASCDAALQCLDRIAGAIDGFLDLATPGVPALRAVDPESWLRSHEAHLIQFAERQGLSLGVRRSPADPILCDPAQLLKAVERAMEWMSLAGAATAEFAWCESNGRVAWTLTPGEGLRTPVPYNTTGFSLEWSLARNAAIASGGEFPADARVANVSNPGIRCSYAPARAEVHA